MASPSTHVMPEHWTELNAAKNQRRLCSQRIEDIKSACTNNCGKPHTTDCQSCYAKVLDEIRGRYIESQEREWFTQRKAFLHELDGLFQDAKDGKRNLLSIESRIESEKEAWYRWVLRKYPAFMTASGSASNRDELRSMLDDPDRSREQLVKMMLEGVGQPPGWPSSVENFAERASAAAAQVDGLKALCADEFFFNKDSGAIIEGAQKYLDEYRATEGMTLEQVIDRIESNMEENKSTQPQREVHQQRLDELRRAKTAFERDKMQAKSRMASKQGPVATEILYNLPPCQVCKSQVGPNEVLSCSLCQVTAQMGGTANMTVYCGEECFLKGHKDHVVAAHNCEAGDKCVQLRDEDEVMEDGTSRTALCRECLELKHMALYCSDRCAEANISDHRQNRHGKSTAAGNALELLVAWTEDTVQALLEQMNPGLKMARVE
ncbi:hypothetical protein CDD81_7399 [Ophiocordyceps australis]|uniref:MYND-type zinc finger protein samB n=1 Tax=Ophiocordyceps australis TaxID=1399860 RepID=A0A2C5YH77_9HYPO|nr:hypothetical protein CDD81_7399 [Ophiocordyceps australis]